MTRPPQVFDIASPAFKARAHETYAALRQEGPLCQVISPFGRRPAWMVLGYDDVAALLKDPRFAKDRANALTPEQLKAGPRAPKAFEPLMRGMLDRDDPDHARLRRLVLRAFTPRRVEALEERTRVICDDLLDRIERRIAFDLVADFALPVPVTVISELLGVPPADRARFARWSKTIIRTSATPIGLLQSLPDMLAFLSYLRRLVAEKRARPADDLISALIAAEEAGDQLDNDELLSMIALLLSAGHETTTNFIGNGVQALLERPDQLARLRAEPELIEAAVEELLRFTSPVETSTFRYAREDLDFAGVRVARGEMVLGAIISANRHERQFASADQLDLSRTPNRHLSFGLGGHFCIGAPLARMEGRIAIGALLARFLDLEFAEPGRALRWRRGVVFRGLMSLALRTAAA